MERQLISPRAPVADADGLCPLRTRGASGGQGPPSVTVNWVTNILDPVNNRHQTVAAPFTTLGQALGRFVPLAPPDFEVTAWLNGEVMEIARHDIVLLPGDNLVMTARPQGGGGGGGSNPLAMVAMVAVIVVATIVTYGAASAMAGTALAAAAGTTATATIGGVGLTAMGAALAYGAGAAVMMVGGYLVSTAFKAKAPDFGGGGGGQEALGASPSYSWQAQGNPLAEGATLPVLYGRFMITPPLIARFVDSVGKEQHLNLLYALAGHKIDEVEAVRINDQPHTSYKNTVFDIRLGDPDQTPIPYFGDLKEEMSVNARLSTDWTTRELPGALQGLAICISYRLYYANDQGGMSWVSANVYVEYRQKGQASWTRYVRYNTSPVTITNYRWSAGFYSGWGRRGNWHEVAAGSANQGDHYDGEPYYVNQQYWNGWEYEYTREAYQWRWIGFDTVAAPGTVAYDYITLSSNEAVQNRFVLYRDHLPEGTYEVRLRLVSGLAESARHGSDVFWDFCQLIQYDDFSYPCTALAGIRALGTDQLSGGTPVVKFLARRDTVWVYDADAKAYARKSASNPAWASYDALHNGAPNHPDPSAYGMSVPYERIVYADFRDWAAWCDQKGYTINLYVESPLASKATLDMIGTMGRGSVVQIGSRFTCMVDRPRDLPRQTFLVGLGNIASQTYVKDWLPMQDRANVLELTYFDAEAEYQRQTVEIYQDGFDSASRSVIKAQRTLYGCTSRQAALTFGRAMMLRNRYLTFMPSFETSAEAIHCLPGDPIDLAIDTLQGGASGRVMQADAGGLVLDGKVVLAPGVQYACELQHIDTDEREYAYIVGVSRETETDALTLLKPLQKIPEPGSKYAFGEVGRTKKTFTIIDMQTASDMRKRLKLLEYVPEIYDDQAYVPPEDDDAQYAFVRNLDIAEVWLPGGPDGSGKSGINLIWRGNALYWNVWIRQAGQGHLWTLAGKTSVPAFTVESGVVIGNTYDLSVSIGTPENGVQDNITIRGKLAPPANVKNFTGIAQGDAVILSWDHIPDADLWKYVIRAGKSWEASQIVLDGVTENRVAWNPPMDGTYRFWIKAVDDYGIESVSAADCLVTIDISTSLNVIWQREELPQGVTDATLERLVSRDGGNFLSWLPSLTDQDIPDHTDQDVGYYLGDTEPGVYTSQVYDLGVVTPFTLRMAADFDAELVGATDLTYPSRTDLTYPADTDVHITSLSTCRLEYRVYDEEGDAPPWTIFTTATDLSGRFLQIRAVTELDSVGVHFDFLRLSTLADVPEQELVFKASIAADGTRFTFAELGMRPMLMEFHVGVTVLGIAALAPVVDEEAQAFTVRCFDVLGNAQAANASIEVRGF